MAPFNSDTMIFSHGDSQAEVFDYVFFGDERYVAMEADVQNPGVHHDARVGWRSGWSARGLSKTPEHVARIVDPVAEAPANVKDVVVFLAFGSTDIDWNLSFKRDVKKENVDTEKFLGEMVTELEGVLEALRRAEATLLAAQGTRVHVVLSMPYVPLDLRPDYLKEYHVKHNIPGYYRVLPTPERRALWARFVSACENLVARRAALDGGRSYVTDVSEAYLAGPPSKFERAYEDHHPDFVKSQHIVADDICTLRFCGGEVALEREALCPLAALFPHIRRPLTKSEPAAAAAAEVKVPVAAPVSAAPRPTSKALGEITHAQLNSPRARHSRGYGGVKPMINNGLRSPRYIAASV